MDGALWELAVGTLEVLLSGRFFAVVIVDSRGEVHMIPRPGHEKMVAQTLADCDFRSAARIAEELEP